MLHKRSEFSGEIKDKMQEFNKNVPWSSVSIWERTGKETEKVPVGKCGFPQKSAGRSKRTLGKIQTCDFFVHALL